MSYQTSKAQFQFGFELGTGLPNVKTLNDALGQRGFEKLNNANFMGGLFLTQGFDDVFFVYNSTLLFEQRRQENENNGIRMSGALLTVGNGFRFINKYKTKLSVLLGVASLTADTRIQIRNQAPESGDLLEQLGNPSSTLIDLRYRSRFYIHTGILYNLKFKAYSLGLKGSYYFRLSKAKWFAGNQELSNGIAINPLGANLSLIVSF